MPDDRYEVSEINLLEKTELWVEDICLEGADLNEIARAAAEVLNLERDQVLVVDVRDGHITMDILKRVVNNRDIAGKEKQLLQRLAQVPGVRLGENAGIHSHGILGLISLPPEEVEETLQRSEQMVREIRNRIARRVKVFPTGFEIKKGMIKDTNSQMIAEAFRRRGYQADIGPVIDDDPDDVHYKLFRAVNEGYGLIITTGGVGAEDKDHTVEGVLRLDPAAATPWVIKYQIGTGRHCKEGVRIAVGQKNESLIIALPGPNDEVRTALEVILNFNELPGQPGKYALAEKIAEALREKLKAGSATARFAHHQHDV
ncbi:MAG: molybdopterin-binding protein [Peptococcaceae bacterium]|nr:molybdopterin-binding protein [Peptococcaceae bacterium]